MYKFKGEYYNNYDDYMKAKVHYKSPSQIASSRMKNYNHIFSLLESKIPKGGPFLKAYHILKPSQKEYARTGNLFPGKDALDKQPTAFLLEVLSKTFEYSRNNIMTKVDDNDYNTDRYFACKNFATFIETLRSYALASLRKKMSDIDIICNFRLPYSYAPAHNAYEKEECVRDIVWTIGRNSSPAYYAKVARNAVDNDIKKMAIRMLKEHDNRITMEEIRKKTEEEYKKSEAYKKAQYEEFRKNNELINKYIR
ncbi:MAG: hypothetical protein FWE47_03595 [Oscillospiraceae bacterium]|nr:hypothetical protein [Oscillospiraceae bacterium]